MAFILKTFAHFPPPHVSAHTSPDGNPGRTDDNTATRPRMTNLNIVPDSAVYSTLYSDVGGLFLDGLCHAHIAFHSPDA